jgi:signal transduction histidine kinase
VGAHLRTETQGAVFILDSSGQPLWSDTADLTIDPSTLARAIAAKGGPSGSLLLTASGQQLLLAHGAIDPPGWTLVSAENIGALQVTSVNELEILPLLLLFVAVLALLAVSFGVANVVRPLQELDRRAAGVAWGDFDGLERPVGGVQEIDDLRRTLAQMAERIRAYQTGMRDYLSAVTLAQEEERRRLAHELHDDTVQALIALKQRTQMAQKAVSNLGLIEGTEDGNSMGSYAGSEPAAVTTAVTPAVRAAIAGNAARASARLDDLEHLIDQELVALRRLIGDLRPIYLEDLGFVPALEMLAGQVRQEHELATGFEVHGEAVRLAPDLELAAYRIVQQAVRNVLAHAAAQSIQIDVSFDTDGITLVVSDDGRGFTPPDQPADLTRGGHFGLMGMRERAMLYGGRLNIASAPGQGATVTAWLPIC